MKIHIIPVETYDNLFSIKEKIHLVKAQRVILNDLESCPIFQEKKSAILLGRFIMREGKTALIVTQNENASFVLLESGFNIVPDLFSAQKYKWGNNTSPQKGFPDKQPRSIYLRKKLEISDIARWVKYSALFIGLSSIFALVLLLSHSATIVVGVLDSVQQIQLPILASSDQTLSNPNNVYFQTDFIDSEAFCSIKTSGKKAIPVSAATGEVELRNLTLEKIAIPEGLVLVSVEDKTKEYVTIESGELSGDKDSEIIIPIMANNPGSQGNAKPGEISTILGPLGLKVSAENIRSVVGGTDVEKSYPSRSDVERLRTICNEKLLAGGFSNSGIMKQDGYQYLSETIQVVGSPLEVFFPGIDVPTETLNMTLNAQLSILSIDEEGIRAYSRPYLDALLLEGYSPSGKIEIQTITFAGINQDGSIKILVELSRPSFMMIDQESIKKYSAGKTIQEATYIIKDLYQKDAEVDIAIKPEWLSTLPLLPFRINVVIGN